MFVLPEIPVVVNVKTDYYDYSIMRGTIWGNPFILGKDGNREEVITKYEEYARNNLVIIKSLHVLSGKRIGCVCKPLYCHGDIIVKLFKEIVLNII